MVEEVITPVEEGEEAPTTVLTDPPVVEKTSEELAEEEAQKVADAKGDDDQKLGAPENYEDFTLPDDVSVDKEAMEAFKPIAKDLGLTQENAQKLVDLQVKTMQEAATAQQNNWDNVQKEWVSAVKADAEIGGISFDENVALARKALETFGTPELMSVLDSTGAGNNPEIVRLLFRVGKAISEDNIHPGGAVSAPKSQAERLFPDMN